MSVPTPLIFNRIAPETTMPWGGRGDLEPVMAYEEEAVRGSRQPAKVPIRNGVPTENVPKYLGREVGRHVQQRISSTFGFDEGPFVFLDLLFQSPYEIEVCLSVHCCLENRVRSCGIASRVRLLTAMTM